MRSPRQLALDDANAQLVEYRAARAAKPSDFGNDNATGQWDGTPDHGPMLVPVIYQIGQEWRWQVLWGIHKHRWPLSMIYCIGRAIDSRGERTDLTLSLDIRDLPRKYVGRFNLDLADGCGRQRHRTIIGRALADGFDLATIVEGRR